MIPHLEPSVVCTRLANLSLKFHAKRPSLRTNARTRSIDPWHRPLYTWQSHPPKDHRLHAHPQFTQGVSTWRVITRITGFVTTGDIGRVFSDYDVELSSVPYCLCSSDKRVITSTMFPGQHKDVGQ